MTTVEPTDRVQILDHPTANPATCVMCGIGGGVDPNRKFIDFDFNIEFYGAVYFCTVCLFPVAKAAGFTSSNEVQAIREMNGALLETVKQVTSENRVLRDALVAVLCGRGPDSIDRDNVVSFVSHVQEFAHFVLGSAEVESESSESSSIEESGGVLTDSDGADTKPKSSRARPTKS